jgi:membrane-associated protein
MVRELMETGWGYPGLWLACFGSGLFVPVPEDVPLMYAGIRVGQGAWSWPVTLMVAFLGAATRDVVCWTVGRHLFGWMIHTGRLSWLVNPRRVERAERLLRRHGAMAVMMGRFMVGFRVPFFVTAGAMGIPLRSFVAYDSLGLLVAVPLAVSLGFWFGEPIAELTAVMLNRAGLVALVLAVVGVALLALRHVVRRLDPDRPSAQRLFQKIRQQGPVPGVSDPEDDT